MDDLIYCGLTSNIQQYFYTLLKLLAHLGFAIKPKKLVASCTSLVCLGIPINTETRTMSVPPDKLRNVKTCVVNDKQNNSVQRSNYNYSNC